MERLFEPQFKICILTVHPQFLPDKLVVPSCVRATCCRGREEIREDKGPEQHRNSGGELPWWIWSWVTHQNREMMIKEKTTWFALSSFSLIRDFLGISLNCRWQHAMLVCFEKHLHSLWSVSTFTCYGSSFLDKCTEKMKGQHENLARENVQEWSK